VGELSDRRSQTTKRIRDLRSRLTDAEAIASGKACVYMTGSFGRCEASTDSDLDLFILGKNDGKPNRDDKQGSQLGSLNEICLKAELIEVTRKLGIREFSGDGRWLVHYSVDDLIKTLGKPEDDVENTFTARLLLLLESQALLGEPVYRDALDDVIVAIGETMRTTKLISCQRSLRTIFCGCGEHFVSIMKPEQKGCQNSKRRKAS
jgi:Nucleotidyltransferase domain